MPGATPVLSQAAEDLALEWTYGNRLNFSWWVEGVDWSGAYTAKIYDRPGGRVLLTFTPTAAYDVATGRTTFAIANVDADSVKQNGWWHMDAAVLDLTRFSGPVLVRA